jgi:hypothetical protein
MNTLFCNRILCVQKKTFYTVFLHLPCCHVHISLDANSETLVVKSAQSERPI